MLTPCSAALLVVLFGWALLVAFWGPAPLAMSFDDAWYYQTIARHVSAGHGFTHDGLQPTNGFHPLWQLVLVPVFALAEALDLGPDASMRALLALTLAGLGAALFALCRSRRGLGCLAALAFLNPYAFKALVNGMESTLLVGLICWLLVREEHWRKAGHSGRLGLLLGLMVLARLEALAFVVAYLVLMPERRLAGRAAALAATPLAAWSAFALAHFGVLLPVSGRHLSSSPEPGVRLALALTLAISGSFAAYRLRKRPALAALALFVAAQLSYVLAFQHVLIPRLWYLAPLLLFALVLLCDLQPRRAVLASAIALWGASSVLCWAHRLKPESYAAYAAAREDGRWLATRLRAGEAAAGWDVGVLAAHARGRVANLEGLVAAPGYDPSQAAAFLALHPQIRYLAQYLPLAELCEATPLSYAGVALEPLSVARYQGFAFESLHPSYERPLVRLIFDLRKARGESLSVVRERLCRSS